MNQIKINQWMVDVGGKREALFTPLSCDPETAMAIAVASFGQGVTLLQDEGTIRINLTEAQLASIPEVL